MSASSALLLLGGFLAIALVAIRWRRTLLFGLPWLVTLNGLPLAAGGSSVRVDQLAACALLIPLVAAVASRTRPFRRDATTWLLLGILVANVVASALHSPAKGYSLAQCANLASAWLVYVIVLNMLETLADVDTMIGQTLLASAVAASLGVMAFLAASAGLSIGGADVSRAAAESLIRPFGAFGTMVEPNIFGSYCAAHFILAVGVLAIEGRVAPQGVRARLARFAAIACAIGLVFSFTRSAWIGAAAGLLVLLLAGRRASGVTLRPVLLPLAVMTVAVLLLLSLPGTAGAFLRVKAANLVNPTSPTATLRLLTYGLSLQQTAIHPIIGWGTFSFAPLVAEGSDFAQYAGWRSIWITNFLLLALHDTGVVGLMLWIAMLGSLLVRGWRSARRPGVEGARSGVLTAVLATLLLPFLATTGFSLGYPWLLAGLLGSHLRVTTASDS